MADDNYENDPRPLTRKELNEFLPSKRAVRAFEKLFDVVPSQLLTNADFIEQILSLVSASKSRISSLEQELKKVQLTMVGETTLKSRITHLEQEVKRLQVNPSPQPNLDPLLKRIEYLESLVGGS